MIWLLFGQYRETLCNFLFHHLVILVGRFLNVQTLRRSSSASSLTYPMLRRKDSRKRSSDWSLSWTAIWLSSNHSGSGDSVLRIEYTMRPLTFLYLTQIFQHVLTFFKVRTCGHVIIVVMTRKLLWVRLWGRKLR